ncbi:hypothetical protein BHE74_00003216 [Ensete ventricosum]|nr:hypothetical protein BHE74_00003216 [Ensete ventricosum]
MQSRVSIYFCVAPSRKFKILVISNVLDHRKSYEHGFAKYYDGRKFCVKLHAKSRWVRGTEERAASHEHGFSLGRFSQGFSLGCFSQVVKVKSLPGELPSSYAHALLVLALLMIAIDAGDGSLFSIPNDERGAKDDFSRG